MRLTRSLAACSRRRFALLAAVLLGVPRAASATSCESNVAGALRNGADAIFLGVVESGRPSFRHPLTQVVNRVRVLRTWKGARQDRVDVAWDLDERWIGVDAFWEALRGDSWQRGDTLLIAAWTTDGRLTTGLCGYWRERAAEREIALLGPGTIPAARASVAHLGLWWPWPVFTAAALLLAVTGLLRVRRQAR